MDTSPATTDQLADRRARLGQRGEDIAAVSVALDGMHVLDRNWRLRTGEVRGELDLVCRDGDTLVVIEVKTRRTGRFGGPMLAVTPDKQARIRALASAYLRATKVRAERVRFDVIGVTLSDARDGGPDVQHVRGAF